MTDKELVALAKEAMEHAYVPYSHFKVGAALLTKDGRVFKGCNVENASYGATNCAERTAVFKAVSEGHRSFKAIAIAGGKRTEDMSEATDFAYPCGVCRQVLREFCVPSDMTVIVCKSVSDYRETTLEELLPSSFGPDNLA